MEEDMERDRYLMKIRQKTAHKRLLKSNDSSKTRNINKAQRKGKDNDLHPFLQSASNFSNSKHRFKAKRERRAQRRERERAYGIMDKFSREYAEGASNNDLIETTLREAENWRKTIAEQELQQSQSSPLSEDSTLGTSLLEYEMRRMKKIAPEIDSVLGYREEPQ